MILSFNWGGERTSLERLSGYQWNMQYVLMWKIEGLKSPYCFFEEKPVIEVSFINDGQSAIL